MTTNFDTLIANIERRMDLAQRDDDSASPYSSPESELNALLMVARGLRGLDEMTLQGRMRQIGGWVKNINLPDNYRIRLDTTEGIKYPYVQVQCYRQDVITKDMGWGGGGKAYVSDHMTWSEFNQMVLGLYIGYVTHEARETFEVKGMRPFHPHISTNALIDASVYTDARHKPTTEQD